MTYEINSFVKMCSEVWYSHIIYRILVFPIFFLIMALRYRIRAVIFIRELQLYLSGQKIKIVIKYIEIHFLKKSILLFRKKRSILFLISTKKSFTVFQNSKVKMC